MKPRHAPAVLAACAVAAAGAAFAPAIGVAGALPAPSEPTRPRLVLFVAVDQMRADYLERFRPVFKSGLKTIAERGAVFTHARYRHACTETGPGHSVLLSGRSPRSSGIVGNSWYDRTLRTRVNVVADPTVRVLGGAGRTASPAYFDGFTVGDMLKTRSPSSKVVGVSLKDRAAILMAGRRADGAFWYEGAGGRFVTSSWYVPEAPRWLESWNARRRADAIAGLVWERLIEDPATYVRLAGEDDAPGEGAEGRDKVFPHRVGATPPSHEFYEGVRRTPYADEMLADFAIAAMKAHDMGTGEATDILAVSFSAGDAIGHAYGPDSQEVMDNYLRLDRTLGRLLDEAERRAGRDRLLVVLSADHGVMPLVETLKAKGIEARRASGEELSGPVERALAARFPRATGLLADPEPMDCVLDREAIARQGLAVADVESTIREALLSTGLVDAVYTQAQLVGPAPADDPFFELHQRAFFAPRSGDLVARVKRYVYLGGYAGGTGHGTPYDYDRHVPLVFLGPGITPGPRDVETGPEDIAWTLGRLLGLPYPQQDSVTDLLPLLK